jgi:hypothetical protein
MINQTLLSISVLKQKREMNTLFNLYRQVQDFSIIEGYRFFSIKNLSREICLVVADFKCQKCGSEENLQYHHLVLRKARDYMNIMRYFAARNYWGNIIILCSNCHHIYHIGREIPEEMAGAEVIPQETIDKIRNKYTVPEQ